MPEHSARDALLWQLIAKNRQRRREEMSSMPFYILLFPVETLSSHCACSSGGEIVFGRWGSMYFCGICPVYHIYINYFVICMIYELSSARVWSDVCRHAEPLSHYPSWQLEPMLESNRLIGVEFNCSKRRIIHAPISK